VIKRSYSYSRRVAKKATSYDSNKKTWHYKFKNARDLSWASSAAFILDGAKWFTKWEKSLAFYF
jgi:hypothetical protein